MNGYIMNNDLANFSVLTGLLVEMATAVKLRLCEPIRQPTRGILYVYYKYSQGLRDLTCWIRNIILYSCLLIIALDQTTI